MPREPLAPFDTPSLPDVPGMTFYIGYLDGAPVATSQLAVSYGIAGVHTVSTLPAYRGRGIGEAMTWRAVLDGRAEGCDAAYLQASEMGYPVYQRMGFLHVADYCAWVRE